MLSGCGVWAGAPVEGLELLGDFRLLLIVLENIAERWSWSDRQATAGDPHELASNAACGLRRC
jgi:hypothetical protein